MMSLPIETVLAVVREGAGRWDTRRIDIELGLRGVVIDHGILRDMVLLSEQGLIERVASDRSGTGPYWRLTQEGERVLAVGLRPDGDEETTESGKEALVVELNPPVPGEDVW